MYLAAVTVAMALVKTDELLRGPRTVVSSILHDKQKKTPDT